MRAAIRLCAALSLTCFCGHQVSTCCQARSRTRKVSASSNEMSLTVSIRIKRLRRALEGGHAWVPLAALGEGREAARELEDRIRGLTRWSGKCGYGLSDSVQEWVEEVLRDLPERRKRYDGDADFDEV